MTIADALFEAQVATTRTRAERRAEAARLLDIVGVPSSALGRYPFEFSGGQRQRIAIARVLAVGAEVILCDEVTSALDVSVQATILNLLKDLQSHIGFSCLFISHDLAAVRYMSETVTVLYAGEIVEQATADDLFEAPQHPYTRALLSSIPEIGAERSPAPLSGELPDLRNPPSGCIFHPRCPVGPKVDASRTICIERDPQSLVTSEGRRAACHFAPELIPEGRLLAPVGRDDGQS
jgi:oligopeptide/dipeptide ABC transporter ATP-binding protein